MRSDMPLSNEDKLRIREEEAFRSQLRDEQQKAQQAANQWKTLVFWLVLIAAAVLLFVVIRTR